MLAAQREKEKKDRIVAGIITLAIGALLFLILFLIRIITPLPPFPEIAGGGGEELNFGIYNEGTGNVEGPGIGEVTSVVVENAATPKAEEANDADKNFENGEAVLENNDKPKIKNNTTVITPIKTKQESKKEENSASSILNAYTKNKDKNGQTGGDGNSGQAGNEGSPEGNPNTNGNGGHGHGDGTDNGDGKGTGPGGPGWGLSGRKMVSPPPKVTDSKEEGVVVVVITVDKQGNVVEADPTGKGTNTSSAVLKSKARQAALQAKFSPSDKYDLQKGTIIFKFQF